MPTTRRRLLGKILNRELQRCGSKLASFVSKTCHIRIVKCVYASKSKYLCLSCLDKLNAFIVNALNSEHPAMDYSNILPAHLSIEINSRTFSMVPTHQVRRVSRSPSRIQRAVHLCSAWCLHTTTMGNPTQLCRRAHVIPVSAICACVTLLTQPRTNFPIDPQMPLTR